VVFFVVIELYHDLEGFEIVGGEEVEDCAGAMDDVGRGIEAKEVLQEEEITTEAMDN